jgi:hypothetical protein
MATWRCLDIAIANAGILRESAFDTPETSSGTICSTSTCTA